MKKLKLGDEFVIGAIQCTITAETSFSGTAHYGFTYHEDDGKLLAGWMPVEFVDKFTGLPGRQIDQD